MTNTTTPHDSGSRHDHERGNEHEHGRGRGRYRGGLEAEAETEEPHTPAIRSIGPDNYGGGGYTYIGKNSRLPRDGIPISEVARDRASAAVERSRQVLSSTGKIRARDFEVSRSGSVILSEERVRELFDYTTTVSGSMLHIVAPYPQRQSDDSWIEKGTVVPFCQDGQKKQPSWAIRPLASFPPGHRAFCRKCRSVFLDPEREPAVVPAVITPIECMIMSELHEAGLSDGKVADVIGCSQPTVRVHVAGFSRHLSNTALYHSEPSDPRPAPGELGYERSGHAGGW